MAHTSEEAAEQSEQPRRVDIVVTADHVFLPLDEDGNAPANWRDVPGPIDRLDMDPNDKMDLARKLDCKRVERRTRLSVPADLAAFLSERDQAEVLSAPLKAGLSAPIVYCKQFQRKYRQFTTT